MIAISEVCTLLAAVMLGLTAGALVCEGAVMVPSWRSLPPASFLAWFRCNAQRLYNFFAPMEVTAAASILIAAAVNWLNEGTGTGYLVAAALLRLSVLATYPLYFKHVNESFVTGATPVDGVAEALRHWGIWHWARTAFAIAAFASALMAI